MSPVLADAIRKLLGYSLAIVLTLLLFRVFSHLANGTLRASEPAIYAFAVLAAISVVWVRAARRVRRERGPEEDPDGQPPR